MILIDNEVVLRRFADGRDFRLVSREDIREGQKVFLVFVPPSGPSPRMRIRKHLTDVLKISHVYEGKVKFVERSYSYSVICMTEKNPKVPNNFLVLTTLFLIEVKKFGWKQVKFR